MNDLIDATSKDIMDIIPRLMQVFGSFIRNCDDMNLPVAHFRILGMLMYHPMKISDLARYQRISKASISESIKLLVEHGWIKKIYDPEDKRVILLQVTDEGKEMMKSMWNKVSASLSKQLKQLPDNELEIIRESLRIMSNKFLKEN
jgi:DNA-binding MarR family transcriptional regulator